MKYLALLTAVFLAACNPNKTSLDADFHPVERGWGSPNPLWADEFDGSTVDPTKWVVGRFCPGGANNEAQCYTNRPRNVSISNGQLVITAWDESPNMCDGASRASVENRTNNFVALNVTCPASGPDPDQRYSSGMIHTRVSPNGPVLSGWMWGRVEIRAKLPYGQGTWPAFWMLPTWNNYGSWPRSGEIDIMEAINLHSPGQNSDFIQSNVHLCAPSTGTYYDLDSGVDPTIQARCGVIDATQVAFAKASKPLPLFFMQNPAGWQPDLISTFHTYAMEWSPYDMRFYVDNKFIGQVLHGVDEFNRAPFRHGFYLIVNLAVGDTNSWPGAADPATWANGDHADLILDWVRVYMCMPKGIAEDCIYNDQGLGEAP